MLTSFKYGHNNLLRFTSDDQQLMEKYCFALSLTSLCSSQVFPVTLGDRYVFL